MTSETIIKAEQIAHKSTIPEWNWWSLFAVIFMFSGMSAIIVGQLLSFLIWLFQQETSQFSLQSFANLLFYISIPMLFVGACCLDKLEEKKKAN